MEDIYNNQAQNIQASDITKIFNIFINRREITKELSNFFYNILDLLFSEKEKRFDIKYDNLSFYYFK